ncbi:hypothetical protein DESUT3_22840 [Desulfuromonas versatilis]|uniref:Uncharacterized protein n=1 Tax=Desulfuromonas versatilis TaxID=2802975 RepID=A0ABN6DYW0_9BACT|nr:hypothetical protein DESUT3_22840 [Desulfuromonas versatilis]
MFNREIVGVGVDPLLPEVLHLLPALKQDIVEFFHKFQYLSCPIYKGATLYPGAGQVKGKPGFPAPCGPSENGPPGRAAWRIVALQAPPPRLAGGWGKAARYQARERTRALAEAKTSGLEQYRGRAAGRRQVGAGDRHQQGVLPNGKGGCRK